MHDLNKLDYLFVCFFIFQDEKMVNKKDQENKLVKMVVKIVYWLIFFYITKFTNVIYLIFLNMIEIL